MNTPVNNKIYNAVTLMVEQLYSNKELLARFRAWSTKKPEDCPELIDYIAEVWHNNTGDIPTKTLLKSIFYTLTLYAIAQQGTTKKARAEGVSFGELIGKIDRKEIFHNLLRRNTLDRQIGYFRQAINMGKSSKKPVYVDYGLFALDLVRMQKNKKSKNEVITDWVLQSVKTKEKN